MRQKRFITIFALVACFLMGTIASFSPAKAGKDEKVAVVNDHIIYMSNLNEEMSRYERQLASAGQVLNEEQQAEMRSNVLDGLINRELLKQESEKQGIEIGAHEVDQEMATLKERFPNEEGFRMALSQMEIDEETLRQQFSQDLAVQKLIDTQVAHKVEVTPEEAKSFYDSNPELFKSPEMVRASHILVKVEPQATSAEKAKAREKIEGIQQRLQRGGEFAELAREYSDCPSAQRGGDLDFFQKGQMVAPFENAAFSLEPGQVSEVVETQFGYHLIKVTDKTEAGVTPYENIAGQIGQHLKQQKVNQELSEYVAQLKSRADVKTYLK